MNIMLRAEPTRHSVSVLLLGNGLTQISEPVSPLFSSCQSGNDVRATKHKTDKAMAPILEGRISPLPLQGGLIHSRQAWKYDFGPEVLCHSKKVQSIRHTWTQILYQRRAATTTRPDLQAGPMSAQSEEAHSDLQSCALCGFAELRCEVRLEFGLSYTARRQG